jgi:hypothetical protein
MINKIIAYAMFIVIGAALFTGFFETQMEAQTAEIIYTIAGLGMIFFGTWAGIRLLKDSE